MQDVQPVADVEQMNEGNGAVAALESENGAAPETSGRALMDQLLDEPSARYRELKYGDVIDGTIMQVDRDEILIDIGSKSEGIIPSREMSTLSDEEKAQLAVGDQVLVFVVQAENQDGHAVLSIDKARQEKSWRRLQTLYEAADMIEAEVSNYNKGGLLVNLDGVRGFVPASQVTEIRGGDDASKQADMARLVGQKLPLKIIEINRHRNRLILSERQAVQERRDAMKEQLIKEIHEGEVRRGRVASIADFGAFVDIGGADGLVHLSELSWSRIKHPSEVLKVGDEVDVYVLGINANEKKIALSIKRTQREPWSQVAEKYQVGQLIRGTITQLANFGAFARIEDGVEGLIHVSELIDGVAHPRQLLREGDVLPLRIIRIDPQRRRIGLSLRRALDDPEARAEFDAFMERITDEGRYAPGGEDGEEGRAAGEATPERASMEASTAGEPTTADVAGTTTAVLDEPLAGEVSEVSEAAPPSAAAAEQTPDEADQ